MIITGINNVKKITEIRNAGTDGYRFTKWTASLRWLESHGFITIHHLGGTSYMAKEN